MKIILLAVFSFFAFINLASADGCNFIPCGTYEGSGSWYDANNKLLGSHAERIEINSLSPSAVTLKIYIYPDGGTPTEPWAGVLTLNFDSAGQFTVDSESGYRFGSGFCVNAVCNVAFRPVKIENGDLKYINAFVNTLRFEGTTLKRYNMVSNSSVDSEIKFERSYLAKK